MAGSILQTFGGGGYQDNGGYQGGSYYGGGYQRPFSWQDFNNLRGQVQYANQQNTPLWLRNRSEYAPDTQQKQSFGYRQMTDLEKFSAGARQTSDFINNAVGNWLFGSPDNPVTGEKGQQGVFGKPDPYDDISAIKLENAPRMIANIPGMFVGSIPDIFAYGSELAAGTPAMQGDWSTGLIEDRALTMEEKAADTGYLALSAASLIPGVGIEAKGAGLGLKALSKAAGKSAAGEAFADAGNIALRGSKSSVGAVERAGVYAGKTGKELNPYRWGDTALNTIGSGTFEALQEGGQTAFEDLRYGQFDLSDPNETAKRVKEGAFWGGLAGGLMGGVPHAANTALVNSRATRGLDRNGNPVVTTTPTPTGDNFYKFWDNKTDQTGFRVTPEMQQLMLEQEGDRRSLQHTGSSMKGVAGQYGQNPNTILYGVRGLRRQYEVAAGDTARIHELAEIFKMTDEQFVDTMSKTDAEIVATINPILQEHYRSKDKSQRVVLSTTRSPATKPGSHQTYFVTGLTLGNTVSFAPTNPTIFGGDLDGDNYSLFQDKEMATWDHLPTRKMMGPKALPDASTGGRSNIPYGSVEIGFEEGGITPSLANRNVNDSFVNALDATIDSHGIHGNDLIKIRRNILESFDVSEQEGKRGITWKHKLAKTLSDIVEEYNAERVNPRTQKTYKPYLAGDDLVSDILSVMSTEGSVLASLDHAVEALDANSPNFMPELEATYENIPTQKGAMPEGKTNLMQVLVWFGKLNSELSTKDSPMFRFKQMSAWNTKFRQMSQDFLREMGIDNSLEADNVERHIKWCMQMINTMHLPIDYVDTVFKVKVLTEVEAELGIDGTSTTKKFGSGLDFDAVKQVVTDVWNRNADLFDKAAQGQFITKGEGSATFIFTKNRIDENEDQSFMRNFLDVFGSWSVSQLAKIDSNSYANEYTLAGLFEILGSSPTNFDTSQFNYVGGDFGKLVDLGVKEYQGKQYAQVSSVTSTIDSCKTMKAEFTVDKDTGVVTWNSDHDIEVNFWAALIQNILGLKASQYLGIWGADHLSHSGWGRYMLNRNASVVKRALVAAGIRYNWRAYIDAVSDPKCTEVHQKAALSMIDMTNPLNHWILVRMLAAGKKETGKDNHLSNKPLMELVDPSTGSYERIAELFDHNEIVHVRSKSDMLLYYALDDGSSVIAGSEISARTKVAKNYASAMQNNAMARARQYLGEVKALTADFHGIKPADVVFAIKSLASSHPHVINPDTYAVAIHDAGFASGRAAEKAKASRAASMHYDSVTQFLGGYSASFLKQLGVSIGSIDAESAYNVADALRQAVFDPQYRQMVVVDTDGHMIEISQENLFQAVNPAFKAGDDITYTDLMKLFDEAPQLLCQLMPHTYEPLSPDAETVSAVLLDKPASMIEEYITRSQGESGSSYIADLEAKKARNKILSDQDSTLLIFGSLDTQYDQLVRDSAAWTDAVNKSADQWGDFIYKVACIDDEHIRKSVIERNFGATGTGIGRRTKAAIDDLMDYVRDKERAQRSASSHKRHSDRLRDTVFLKNIESKVSEEHLARKYRDQNDTKRDISGIAAEEALRRRTQHDRSLALTEAYLQYEIGSKVDLLNGDVSSDVIDFARRELQSEVDENGNLVYSKADIDTIIDEAMNADSVVSARRAAHASIISRGEMRTSDAGNAKYVIGKVRNYWTSRKYKRLASEYFKDENAFNEWQSNIIKAYTWNPVGVNSQGIAVDADGWTKAKREEWLAEQVSFWNREILSSSLQETYDTYGAGTASNELALLEDAKDFVTTMVDEVVCDSSISKVASVDIDSLTMPRVTYQNKATAPHITAASIELESGGAPIMSGQNAGSYQYLTVLDFVEKDFSCPADLRTGLTRDEAIDLANSQDEPLNYVLDDGTVETVTAQNLEYAQRYWTDERIANTRFAPQRDCLCGAACHNHNSLPVTGTSGTYIGGRYTVADLCWYLSERRVFKSKKRRRVFDKISHIISEAADLKNTEFVWSDRGTLLENIRDYQERVANHINKVFIDEHMDDEFGLDDARIVAQFMTPAIEITYTVDGETRRDTISKWSLANDSDFAKELAGDGSVENIDPSTIVSAKPVAMSITDVCKKLTGDLLRSLDTDENYAKGITPKRGDLSGYVAKGMSSWRGKILDSSEMVNFLKNQPVIRRSMGRSILFGSSPNVMQNFMDFGGSMQTASSYSKTALIERAITSNREDKASVVDFNRGLKIDTSNLDSDGRPIVIVKYVQGDEAGTATPYAAAMEGRFAPLRLRDENFAVPHAYNAIAIPSFTEGDTDAAGKYWDEAEAKGRVLLVPEGSTEDFIRALDGTASSNKIRQSLLAGEILINNHPYVVFDPYRSQSFIDNDMPQTYLVGFDPAEMLVGYQDRGLHATSDSGSKVTPSFMKLSMPFDTDMTFNDDVLIGNMTKLKGRVMHTIDLDGSVIDGKTHRMILREEVASRLAGNKANTENSPFRIVLPKFDDTYKISDDIVLQSIKKYLDKGDRQLYPDGTVAGEVTSGDCMNILAVKYGSETYYIPLIYNRGGGPVSLQSVILNGSELRTGTVSMKWSAKMTLQEAEGLKIIYPTIAYKSYATVMSQEDIQRMIRTGINITIVSNGQTRNLETNESYSGSTEDSRLIDAGYQVKIENLANLGKILPRHYFEKYDPQTRSWVRDYKKFNGMLTPQQVDRLCEWNSKSAWWDFVYDTSMQLHPDPEVNAIFRKVARAALSCGMNPLFVFANIYTNGKIRYVDYNHNLVFSVLQDTELERFFYAMDQRFCFDGNAEIGTYSGRLTPYIDRNGWLLGADGKYHPGHLHFVHPTDDSSMLGVPSGQVKFGIQQILNESLIEGIRSKGEISTLIEYARAKQGDPSNYIYGGKYADDWYKEKSDKELREMADRWSYDDLNVSNYLRRSRTPSEQSLSRRRKKFNQVRNDWNKRIDFTGKDGTGKADMSDLSEERQMYDMAVDRFREAFKSDDPNATPLQNFEIEKLYKQTTASTLNDGHGTYQITVRDFSDWCNAVVDRLEHGEFPFEIARSVRNRPVIAAVTSDLLDRLMMSPAFRNFDGHEWTRDMFVDLMFADEDGKMGTVPKLMESLDFASIAQKEAVYTAIDIIANSYGKSDMSRPIGDYGLHLSDLINNTDPVYGSIVETEEYSGLYERRKQTERMIKRTQDIENRKKYKRVPTYSSETGYMGQAKRLPNGTVWNTLSAVAHIMATLNPALPTSAIIQRYVTQGQNRMYIWLDRNITKGIFSDNMDGIVINNREALNALGENAHVQELWIGLNMMTWSGEDLLNLQNANSWEDIHNLIEAKKKNMGWVGNVRAKAFYWASGGRRGVPWQIRNWADRLACMITEEEFPELTEVVDNQGTTRYEQMLVENPENFVLDFLTTRDNNPYFVEATRARNWVVDREHAGQSVFGLALSKGFEQHPLGRFMFISGLCKFPHYAYNVGGWFVNHFAPVSTIAYVVRAGLIHMANNGNGKFSEYLADLGVERTQIYGSIKEAVLNDVMMMGSTAVVGMLFGLGMFEPPDDEYYDEYGGRPEEWTILGMRLKENWWLMDVLGPFAAVAATWKSIEIGKPRLDLLQNWMTEALWSNPIIRASDIAKTMLDPTEQYLEEYDNVTEQYKEAPGGAPSMLDLFLDDNITYGLNWFGQFVTPSFLKEISQSKEFLEYERSYKKVENEEGELVYTDYLDSRIRKATRNNIVLGLLMDGITAVAGRSSKTGYVSREMPKVKIPDQNQLDSMHYFSLYNEDGSEKTEEEKQVVAFEVLATLQSTEDLDALYKQGFVVPMETRIYASQMLNDMRQYETDQYNAWVQETGMDAYLLGNGNFSEGMKISNETRAAYKDDMRQIGKLFDKLWSDEMNRGLQMYYRLPTTYAQTASGEWYATGYARSISPLQIISPFIAADGVDNSPIFGTDNMGTMGRAGNWETPSAVVEGASAGSRNLVPIDPDKITRPKLEDFASDENGGYSDTKAGKMYSEASTANGTTTPSSTTTTSSKYPSGSGGSGYPRSSGGGYSRGGGGGGGGRGYTPNTSAPSSRAPVSSTSVPRTNLSKTNVSRIMTPDRLIDPDEIYLRPDFETKGSREAYRRSDI